MRLTNRKTYSDLKNNAERLQAKGMEVSISDLMYIKLAEYENAEEDAHEACKEMQACVNNWDEYIEREKAIERIQPHVKPQTAYGEGYLRAIEHATNMLSLMPAADVEPIEHGKWEDCEIRGSLSQCCSICGCDSGVLYPYRYCPNCGARMDLKGGETK